MKNPTSTPAPTAPEQPSTQATAPKSTAATAPKSTATTAPKIPTAPKAPNAMGKDEDGPTLDYSKFNKPKAKESGTPTGSLDYGSMKTKPAPKPWAGAKAKQQEVRAKVDQQMSQTASEYFKEKFGKTALDPRAKAKSIKSAIKRVPRKMIGKDETKPGLKIAKNEEIEQSLNTPFIPRFLNLQKLAKTSPKEVLAEISLAKMAEIIGKLAKSQSVTPEDVNSLQKLRASYAKAEKGYIKYGDHVPSEEPPRNEDKDPKEVDAEGSGGEITKEELAAGDPNEGTTAGQIGTQSDMIKEELKTEFKPKFYKGEKEECEKGALDELEAYNNFNSKKPSKPGKTKPGDLSATKQLEDRENKKITRIDKAEGDSKKKVLDNEDLYYSWNKKRVHPKVLELENTLDEPYKRLVADKDRQANIRSKASAASKELDLIDRKPHLGMKRDLSQGNRFSTRRSDDYKRGLQNKVKAGNKLQTIMDQPTERMVQPDDRKDVKKEEKSHDVSREADRKAKSLQSKLMHGHHKAKHKQKGK